MTLFWDKDGTPLDTIEWAHKYEDYDYRFVGHDQVGPYRISTLWMGMAPVGLFLHTCQAPPAVFQTKVFIGRQEHGEERNYYTEAEALAGHQETLTLLRATCLTVDDITQDPRCPDPDPTPDEPWVTDPECGTCGHKMSCCSSGYGECVCNSDD